MDAANPEMGRRLAEALAAKDFERVGDLVDPELDFRGLTPNRTWEVSSATDLVSEVLEQWFEDGDHIEELVAVETGALADRDRVTYSFRGTDDEGPFLVEQVAYYTVKDDRIDWLRVLCSGFRPPPDA